MKKVLLGLSLVGALALSGWLVAPVYSADPQLETVVGDLDNACGIAIQPETGHVFVAEASRIFRVVNGKAETVIEGFAQDIYGKGPMYAIGALGLGFLDKDTLVVGDGSLKDGEELVRVYKIPAAGQPAIKADKMEVSYSLPAKDDLKPEGNFYGVAVTKTAIYITSNGDDTKGWVVRAKVNGTKVEPLERFLATKEAVNVDAPVAITTRTIAGKEQIVVGQFGEVNVANDSLLTFYNTDGKLLLNLPTGLHDITGLAYSPKGQLFATDFAWIKTEEGGLFQMVKDTKDGKQICKTEKIVSLDKPTALAFGKDGELYITIIGEPKKGKLLKLAAGL